jgi:hypothetical protein
VTTGSDFNRLRRRDRVEALAWALIVASVVLSAPHIIVLGQNLARAATISRLTQDQQQRIMNGPLVAFAQQLEAQLPAESCLHMVYPEREPNQSIRPYIVVNLAVLSHNLHPRAVRLAVDVDEALDSSGCGVRPHYILVWIEPDRPEIAGPLFNDLDRLMAADNTIRVSEYLDAEGNAGHLFRVGQG